MCSYAISDRARTTAGAAARQGLVASYENARLIWFARRGDDKLRTTLFASVTWGISDEPGVCSAVANGYGLETPAWQSVT